MINFKECFYLFEAYGDIAKNKFIAAANDCYHFFVVQVMRKANPQCVQAEVYLT
jgi:hypothetical protein